MVVTSIDSFGHLC